MNRLWRWSRRRLLTVVGVSVLSAFTAMVVGILVVTMVTASVTVPLSVAAKVLGDVSSLFGGDGKGGSFTGDQLASSAENLRLECDAAPAADPPPTPAPAPPTPTEEETADPPWEPAGTPVVSPIRLGVNGSLSRQDAEELLAPLGQPVSALRAHVWFLYRLSGMGTWPDFVDAYTAAGLSDAEESDNAPLRQVQLLNTAGADVDRYRLTAAALVAVGEQTGRFTDPYPGYREMVNVELLTGCRSDSGMGERRMSLPAPASADTPSP